MLSHKCIRVLRGPGVRVKHWIDYFLLIFFPSLYQSKGHSLGTESKRKIESFSTTRRSLPNYAAFFEPYFLGVITV